VTGPEYIPGVTLHARARMVERFGRDLTRAQWLEVVAAVVDRRGLMVSAKHNCEIWLVGLGALRLALVWSPGSAAIVTVKDPDEFGISNRSDRAREGRVRSSLVIPGGYLRGKRRKSRTVWQ
jgi:hypothetical protein